MHPAIYTQLQPRSTGLRCHLLQEEGAVSTCFTGGEINRKWSDGQVACVCKCVWSCGCVPSSILWHGGCLQQSLFSSRPLPPMSDRCRLYLVACVQENHIHHPPSVAPNPQQTNLWDRTQFSFSISSSPYCHLDSSRTVLSLIRGVLI